MALDGVEHGFFALYGDPAAVADLGGALEHWRLAWPDDWALKRYAACYATHRAIDAALRLRPGLAAGRRRRWRSSSSRRFMAAPALGCRRHLQRRDSAWSTSCRSR